MQLGFGLDVDLGDAGLHGEGDLGLGLANAREDDAVRRHAGGQGPADLALRHHVSPGAQVRQGSQHRDVRIGLHREGDQRVPKPRAQQGVAQDRVVPLQRGAGIDIDRRADGLRDPRQGNAFAGEFAVAKLEVVHRRGLA
jgi:hypothetical protein